MKWPEEKQYKKIADLIGKIQTDTMIAVEAMNGGTREVQVVHAFVFAGLTKWWQ